MKVLGMIVFVLFGIRSLLSLGNVLSYAGYEDVFYYLGDLAANVLLMIYLYKSVLKGDNGN